MKILTPDQISKLQQGNLDNFTTEYCYDCDEQGNGILHHLVKINASSTLIQQALDLGVSPYTFNKADQSPIELAINQGNSPVAMKLLEEPIKIDEGFLNLILGGAIQAYETASSPDEREAVIGFFASRLCGTDIHDLLNVHMHNGINYPGGNNAKYVAHLQWFKGASGEGVPLELFSTLTFLPLRIRSILELLIRLYTGSLQDNDLNTSPSMSSFFELREQHQQVLLEELKRDLQTYFIGRIGSYCIFSKQRDLLASLAIGICEAVKKLNQNQAVVFDAGWLGHTFYLMIKKIEDQKYALTIHNLGDRSTDWHPQENEKVFPAVLGFLDKVDWESDGRGYEYTLDVIRHVFPYNERSLMKSKVYCPFNAETIQGLIALPEQKVGNCVVANHDATRRHLMDEFIYTWLQSEEVKIPASHHGDVFRPYTMLNFSLWTKALISLIPGYKLIPKLYEYFKARQEEGRNSFSDWLDTQSSFVQPTITFHNQGVPKQLSLENWIDQFLQKHEALPHHTLHLLLGEPGAGKSTCLQWCAEKLWKAEKLLWLPIIIPLAEISQSKNFINEYLEKILGNIRIDILKKHYRFLFLLDAYDELVTKVGVHNILMEAQLHNFPGVTLITCRSTHENQSMALGNIQTVQFLMPFSDGQIDEYLTLRQTSQQKTILFGNKTLRTLIKTPLLLKLAEKIEGQEFETRYDIYTIVFNEWFKREFDRANLHPAISAIECLVEQPSDFIPKWINATVKLMGKIAFEMFRDARKVKVDISTVQTIFFETLKSFLKKYSIDFPIGSQVFRFLLELLPLQIMEEKYYQFTHRTFQEFFAAYHLSTHYEEWNKIIFSKELGILPFLGDTKPSEYKLLGIITNFKNTPEFAVASGNALTLFNYLGYSSSGLNLSDIYVKNANVSGMIFDRTDFSYSHWEGTDSVQANFQEIVSVNSDMDIELSKPPIKFRENYLDRIAMMYVGAECNMGGITCMVLSPVDSSKLTIAYRDGVVIIINLKTLNILWEKSSMMSLFGMEEVFIKDQYVKQLKYTEAGDKFVTLSYENEQGTLDRGMGLETRQLWVWDAKTMRPLREIKDFMANTEYFHNTQFSCLLINGRDITAASDAGCVYRWSIDSQKLVCKSEKTTRISCLAMNEQYLISGGDCFYYQYEGLYNPPSRERETYNGILRFWAIDTLQQNKEKIVIIRNKGITHLVTYGNKIIVAGYDGSLHVVDLYNGQILNKFRGHSAPITELMLRGNELISSSLDKTLCLWDIETGEILKEFRGHHAKATGFVIYHNEIISSDETGKLRRWDLKKPLRPYFTNGHQRRVNALLMLDGKIISASNDKKAKVWHVAHIGLAQECINREPITCLAMMSDQLVSGDVLGNLNFWNIQTGEKIRSINTATLLITKDLKNAIQINCIVISDKKIISGHENGEVYLVDTETNRGTLLDMTDFENPTPVLSLAINNNELVVGTGSRDFENVLLGYLNHPPKTKDEVRSQSMLYSCQIYNCIIQMLDINLGRYPNNGTKRFSGHVGCVITLKITNHYVISGSTDRMVKLWKKDTGKCVRTFLGHSAPIITIFIHPKNNNWLLTVAQDGEVIAWDIKNKEGKPLERRKFPACTACCIAEDGVSITLALEDNSILYADLAPPMTQQIFADTTPIPPWQICWVRGRAV